VVLKDNLARQSRDICQKSYIPKTPFLNPILQENVSKHWFLLILNMVWQFWR